MAKFLQIAGTILRQTIALLLAVSLSTPLPAQENSSGYTFHAQSELVLVNVTVRDKNGNFVRDLKPEDFTILEDNKPQHVASFDVENTDAIPAMNVPQVAVLQGTPQKSQPSPTVDQAPNPMRDRLLSGSCFLRFVVVEDESQRHSICQALNQWLIASAEKATGLPADFSSSLELSTASVGRAPQSDTASVGRALLPADADIATAPARGNEVSAPSTPMHSGAASNLHCPQPFPSGF